MITALRQLNLHNPLNTAWIFALTVLILLPALLFSSFFPDWTPFVAIVGLVVIFVLRGLACGYIIGYAPLDGILLLFVLILPINLWATSDLSITLPWIYAFIANLALFAAVAAQWDAAWLSQSGWLLLVGVLMLGVVILWGTDFSGNKLPFIDREFYLLLPGGFRPFWNIDGAGFNSNHSGGLLAIFLPLVAVLSWQGNSWQQRDVAKVVTVILMVLLLLTQSRGALLGVMVALLVITLLQSQRWVWFWLIVFIVIAIGTYRLGPDGVLTALGQDNLGSVQARQELWGQALRLMNEFPLTGVGLGMFEPITTQYYTSYLSLNGLNHAHNLYLNIGAEMGILGLVVYMALFLTLFYKLLRRALDRRAGYSQVLALGLLGSLIALLTHGVFDVMIYAPRSAIFIWGLFGLMVAVLIDPIDEYQED